MFFRPLTVFAKSSAVAAGAIVLLSSCSDTPDEDTTELGSAVDIGVDSPDITNISDTNEVDDERALPEIDASDESSGGDAETDTFSAGQLGSPCDEDADCEQPYCVDPIADGIDDSFCSVPCLDDSSCPAGFSCTLLPGSGADVLTVCFPDTLCVDADEDGFGLGPDCDGADCDDSNGLVSPRADEVCDGVDNDCDTQIDDNPVGEGTDCTTSFAGVCAAGRLVCNGGFPECVSRIGVTEERCDGLDNDCDGLVDEDAAGAALARSCYDGPADTAGVGLCTAGVETCAGGEFAGCVGQILPSSEVCDLADNDCDGDIDEEGRAPTWYRDLDGDGFGDASSGLDACAQPANYVANSTDCDDTNGDVFPGAAEVAGDGVDQNCDGFDTCWVDGDLDGFHGGVTAVSRSLLCDAIGLADATAPDGDCNDADADIFPGAIEIPGDEIDQNCDSVELCFVDADNDGYRLDSTVVSANLSCGNLGEAAEWETVGDCNDEIASINPGAAEQCDDIDQNCNDIIDEDVTTRDYWPDLDGDTWGASDAAPISSCRAVALHVIRDGDCNDANDAIRPGVAEIPGDGVDQNCDASEVCYADADGDGYRTGGVLISADEDCDDSGEALAVMPDGDCNDGNGDVNPAATENVADGVDSNCDRIELCFVDRDGDGYRVDTIATVESDNLVCSDDGEASASAPTGDCDDDNNTRHPGAAELCDGIDQNCNSLIDDGVATLNYYPDVDGDTFGDAAATPTPSCRALVGRVTNNTDCNDRRTDISPIGVEVPGDSVDQNCDGRETCFQDADDDGFRPNLTAVVTSLDTDCNDSGEASAAEPAGDCNDLSTDVNPAATELPADAIDQNCDRSELCYLDADNDGYRPNASATVLSPDLSCNDSGEATAGDLVGDCDDSDGTVYPGAPEVVDNGIDEDCFLGDLCYVDNDNDGFRTSATVVSGDLDCLDAGEARASDPDGDCNDANTGIFPGAYEAIDDGVDNDCDRFELCYRDGDGDGFRPGPDDVVTSANLVCTDFGEASRGAPFGDCNDGNDTVFPGAIEVPGDEIDQNCDGLDF